jgi:hypothetical protein
MHSGTFLNRKIALIVPRNFIWISSIIVLYVVCRMINEIYMYLIITVAGAEVMIDC